MPPIETEVEMETREGRQSEEDVMEEVDDLSDFTISTLSESTSSFMAEEGPRLTHATEAAQQNLDNQIGLSHLDRPAYRLEVPQYEPMTALHSDAVEMNDNILGGNRKGRIWTRTKFWAILAPTATGVSSAIIALVTYLETKNYYVHQKKKNPSAPPKPVPNPDHLTVDQMASLDKLAKSFNEDRDETEFWSVIRHWVESSSPSIEGQFYMMTSIQDVATMTDWPEDNPGQTTVGDQINSLVEQLITEASDQGRIGPIYDKVATFPSITDKDGSSFALTRYLRAGLCKLALPQIAKLKA